MHIYMASDVSLRLWYYIQQTHTEIGGMGYGYFDEDGDVNWTEIFLLPQIVSSSEVDFDETGGDAFAIEKAINDGVLSDPAFVWVSWHSHAKLGTFWSGTDEARIKALREAGIQHLISYVGNHDRKYRARYDAYNINHHGAVIPHVTMDNLTASVDPNEQLFLDCDAEIEQHVVFKKVTTTKGWTSTTVPNKPAEQKALPSRTLTEAEQADSAFEITPTEGEDGPAVLSVGDVVDDDEATDEQVAEALAQMGFHVEEVVSSDEH